MDMQAENLNITMTGETQADHIVENNVNVVKKGKVAEIIAFTAFIILSVVMFIFHEPWYDEIQAWMVATDASIGEMIFTLPHYEGHPPFWTLILAIFAKTGVPMEIGLRIPNLIFVGLAAFLVIFKAPFKKWIRCMVPFSYFLFYQYTVICRPYSMMFLADMARLWAECWILTWQYCWADCSAPYISLSRM